MIRRAALIVCASVAGLGCSGGAASESGALSPADPKSGGAATTLDDTSQAYGNSIRKLSDEQAGKFSLGHSVFSRAWVTAPATTDNLDGLGPLFNARACASCHSKDGRSAPFNGSGALLGMLLRLSIPGTADNGGPKPDPVYGDQLRPYGILGVPGDGTPHVSYEEEPGSYADGSAYSLQRPSYSIDGWNYGEPGEGLMISPRTGPSVIGLGLLEAVPEDEILANVHPADADGVQGVPNYVWDAAQQTQVLGRFGWKANQPSTLQQTAGAFLGDIGITSSLFRHGTCTPTMTACNEATSGADPDFELSDQSWQAVGFYMRSLAVPARRDVDDPVALRGEQLFTKFGCASCHRTTLHTGPADADALANQTIHPYTDLLLHDMGPELADGRPDFQASGSQWRTAPLWGLGLLQKVNQHSFMLHDARARGFAEAILWHGGEGATARENFRLASADEREALLKFLESL
ncbi:MAG TPA: di-heme oxidoredictase family protein [Polyangiaceae bacterium]|nr:di-heme oxidoredictase family protein [Polyangiaceae bacterium]